MNWNKLEYGKWPEGMILLRIDYEDASQYEVGYIKQSETYQDAYFYIAKYFNSVKPLPSKISIDSIYDHEPYYIKLKIGRCQND